MKGKNPRNARWLKSQKRQGTGSRRTRIWSGSGGLSRWRMRQSYVFISARAISTAISLNRWNPRETAWAGVENSYLLRYLCPTNLAVAVGTIHTALNIRKLTIKTLRSWRKNGGTWSRGGGWYGSWFMTFVYLKRKKGRRMIKRKRSDSSAFF